MKRNARRIFILLLIVAVYSSCKEDKAAATTEEPDNTVPAAIDYSYKMGVNLNEQVDVADQQDLADTKTKWVRCFIEVIDLYKTGTLNTDAKVAAFIALKSKGYNTALSLKFNFKKRGFPVANSPDWNGYLNFIQPLLTKVMPYTDVIIVGNEPFIEAEQAHWNEPLNSFYKAACERTNNYLNTNQIEKPIFLGAFDNLYLNDRNTHAGYNNLFSFARSANYLAGVDLHIHHTTEAEMTTALAIAKGKIRADQKVLVTEFSLMKHWRANNSQPISSAFIAAANTSTTDKIIPPPVGITKNHQYINYALKEPRPAEEWNAFWIYSPYLESKKSYLCTAYNAFMTAGNVFLTFYALRQSYPANADFTETTDPWVLNGLFMNLSIEKLNGRNQKSYSFLDQFKLIVDNQNPCNQNK